jgi:hypothetical protein
MAVMSVEGDMEFDFEKGVEGGFSITKHPETGVYNIFIDGGKWVIQSQEKDPYYALYRAFDLLETILDSKEVFPCEQ